MSVAELKRLANSALVGEVEFLFAELHDETFRVVSVT